MHFSYRETSTTASTVVMRLADHCSLHGDKKLAVEEMQKDLHHRKPEARNSSQSLP